MWFVTAVRQAVGDTTVNLSAPLLSGVRRRGVSKQQAAGEPMKSEKMPDTFLAWTNIQQIIHGAQCFGSPN